MTFRKFYSVLYASSFKRYLGINLLRSCCPTSLVDARRKPYSPILSIVERCVP